VLGQPVEQNAVPVGDLRLNTQHGIDKPQRPNHAVLPLGRDPDRKVCRATVTGRERRAVLGCAVCSGVRFPTEVNREDKHRILMDGKPDGRLKVELDKTLNTDVGVDTTAPK
jgi:hypothetical protein